MSSIIGIFRFDKEYVDLKVFQKSVDKLKYWSPDKSRTWSKKNVAFGNHLLFTTPESRFEILPLFHEDSECCITCDARIDYRDDLIRMLDLDIDEAHEYPDSLLILNSYLKWSHDCVKYLHGDFAFAIWDGRSNTIYCARDHFGCRPLYFHIGPDIFIFSSDPKAFIPLIGNHKIKEKYIVDCLISIVPANNDTAFHNIEILEPAHSMVISTRGIQSKENYWKLCVDPSIQKLQDIEAIALLKNTFIHAVNQRMRSTFPIGAELSGGIDSSGIVGIAARDEMKYKNPLIVFSHVLSDSQKDHSSILDEDEYSTMVANYCNITEKVKITGEESLGAFSALKKVIRLSYKPINQVYSAMSDQIFKEANSRKIKVLLSGFGGDECVSSSANALLTELAKNFYWKELYKEVTYLNLHGRLPVLRKFVKIILNSFFTRYYDLFVRPMRVGLYRSEKYNYLAVSSELESKYKTRKRFYTRMQKRRFRSIRDQQLFALSQSNISGRLESSYRDALRHNLEYAYPLLDIKLIKMSYSLSSRLKYKNGIGRYAVRLALEGLVPEVIRWRSDKGFNTIPNVYDRLKRDELLYIDLIEESKELNTFHYVDYDKLLKMLKTILSLEDGSRLRITPRSFLNSISVLIAQKMQRQGEVDIGIKL